MQDYGSDLPSRGLPPFGGGPFPDGMISTGAVLLLILAVVIGYVAYRAGRRFERQKLTYESGRAPEIIFLAVRRQIDISLLATGERAFGPVRILIETINAYLGPVLLLVDGHGSLAVSVQKLKKALATERKKVPVEHDKGHGHTIGHGGEGSTVIITTRAPAQGQGGQGFQGITGSQIGAQPNVSAAAAVGPGGGVQVVQPARVIEIPAHDSGHGHGPAHKPLEKEVELSARERALAVREALEALSDYWQKERVETELRAAQKALTITRPIGDKSYQPARARPPTPAGGAVASAARSANRGFPLFKL